MAVIYVYGRRERRQMRRNRIFRDLNHPFELLDDVELFQKFCFRRHDILEIADEVSDAIQKTNRKGTVPPLLQVMTALRFYASGAFQDICGELVNISQATTCRIIARVTDALLRRVPEWISMPNHKNAERTKREFFTAYGFPTVIEAVDGTHICIEAPDQLEHEFVNRKNYHSIKVQVNCNFDLIFWNCIAKWPGSVHDARILREYDLFPQFDGANRPLRGFILGDSGYMQRNWLMVPVANPDTEAKITYNHNSARTAIETAIGVLKRHWHCLRELRLEPTKACKVITVCAMLHNCARLLNLDLPDEDSADEGHVGNDDSDDEFQDPPLTERAKHAACNATRAQVIHNHMNYIQLVIG